MDAKYVKRFPATAYLTAFYNGYMKGRAVGEQMTNIELGTDLFDTYISELQQRGAIRNIGEATPDTEKPTLAFKTARAKRSETLDGWSIVIRESGSF